MALQSILRPAPRLRGLRVHNSSRPRIKRGMRSEFIGGCRWVALVVAALMTMAALAISTPVRGATGAGANAIYQDVPPSIDVSRKYLFYMHGTVVEEQGRNAMTPGYGRYEYDDIVQALGGKGFVVISEVRSQGTRPDYGRKVAGQVQSLPAAGVQPENITVSGHSKGGMLSMVASAALGEPKVNFVIMAGCGAGRFARGFEETVRQIAPRLKGRMLSLYDTVDREAGSCQAAFDRAQGLEYKETTLKTGLGHGLFYSVHKEWIDLVTDWASKSH